MGKENINDNNIMEVWMEAERCEDKILCETAIKHLVERPKEKPMKDVPGFVEAFKSGDKPLVELMAALSDKILGIQNKQEEFEVENRELKVENRELKVEMESLREQVKNPKLRCGSCQRDSSMLYCYNCS